MYKILLIEDEENIASFVRMELEYEGYKVEVCDDGVKGFEEALENDYNLILLDLMLPKLNGLEVCRRLRKVKNTPIIMLTARDSVMDKVSGLQIGADDYISKPFAIEELLARIEALLRRVNEIKQVSNKLKFKDIKIDLEARIVEQDNEEVVLTAKEYELLVQLLKNQNKVLSRDNLLENIWGYDYEAETNVVDVYIRHLRSKLKNDGYIQTIRGIGYVIR
ncbi:response regulator transcription factor [Terrisporobacter mayombei]|uniref:Stage 0 sporulation protein A homolog n=1 Tax=Terrisporobacter mayombei TaxID=1541 RepID=A0ABY9Q0C8_9FIRM|nr:response regulator transcription factor [Terrisporobacter mayombei]MCC3866635.1 response regulator transcription factor [Terrisporobacter mayombei]WMT80869.1 Response regulator ArlR [Terrisporobacter mayombei]